MNPELYRSKTRTLPLSYISLERKKRKELTNDKNKSVTHILEDRQEDQEFKGICDIVSKTKIIWI